MAEWISESEWESVKAEIIARGPTDRDFPLPSDPRWERLTGKSKAWALSYFRSGGDARSANQAGGYSTPSHLTLYRFVGDQTPAVERMRTYLSALNDSFKQAMSEGYSSPVEESPGDPVVSPSTLDFSEPIVQPPIYVPEIVVPTEQVDEQEAERDTEKAKKIWRSAASYTPGDFMLLQRDDETNAVIGWDWDLEKLKKAPPGVLKGIGRDGKGFTRVEFNNATESAKLLADHYKPKETDGGRVDIRSVVVNILQSGDPSERYRLDQLAKSAAERLKIDREKKQLAG